MSDPSSPPWSILTLGHGHGRGRHLAMALGAMTAIAGALAAVGLLRSRARRQHGEGVLLVHARSVHTVHLKYRESLAHNVRLFRFALPKPGQVLGVPVGQHLYLRARVGGRLVVRPYTPVSPKKQKGTFDLIIKIYNSQGASSAFPKGGTMSQYLDNLKVGDTVEVQGPKGTFEYLGCGDFWFRDGRGMLSACHLGMVAAGSGITPILQILRQIFGDPDDGTEVQMVDVNSSEADIIVRDELDALTRHFPGRFSVCHVLSRMPDVLPDGLLCVKGPLNLEILANQLFHPGDSTMVLVCGPPKLVSDVCRPALAKLGHDPSRVVIY